LHPDIRAFVIAVNSSPRNSMLVSDLENSNVIKNVELVSAITPTDANIFLLEKVLSRTKVLIGRKVSEVEGCITLSHSKAHKIAARYNEELYLFCEDDIKIESIEDFNKAMTVINSSLVPQVWTLYSPDWAVWKKRKTFFESKFPPPYASCYVMNNSALRLALDSEIIGLADWPIWSKKVLFTLLVNSKIVNVHTLSYAEHDRRIAKNDSSKIKSLFYPKYLFTVPIVDRIRHIILYPLFWKIYKHFRNLKIDSANKSVFLN
jgi:GR25 family glycosyltransferase involved in LPS biosynthesis